MRVLGAAALISIAGFAAMASSAATANDGIWPASRLHGRWRVDDTRAQFTGISRPYKTIDIAPCVGGLCGVSVNENGTCGPTLFRFPVGARRTSAELYGQVVWASTRRTITIAYYDQDYPDEYDAYDDGDDEPFFLLRIGNRRDIWANGDVDLSYDNRYVRRGQARCSVR